MVIGWNRLIATAGLRPSDLKTQTQRNEQNDRRDCSHLHLKEFRGLVPGSNFAAWLMVAFSVLDSGYSISSASVYRALDGDGRLTSRSGES